MRKNSIKFRISSPLIQHYIFTARDTKLACLAHGWLVCVRASTTSAASTIKGTAIQYTLTKPLPTTTKHIHNIKFLEAIKKRSREEHGNVFSLSVEKKKKKKLQVSGQSYLVPGYRSKNIIANNFKFDVFHRVFLLPLSPTLSYKWLDTNGTKKIRL